ncbi:hypothetical protein HGM15179_015040 [Zosterops borbonicus]|uniref:Reverse transcriptase n=1 Tax=Zosterops borbonicus TaxID=364589 RepID=A0A8K1G555_9PASS|nr:hypothetical protein HGM15179_015040 [Zosterops borbonicus]
MVNSPTICQITVDRVLAPIRYAEPTATIIQYMDDILIAAPSMSQVDRLITAISQTLRVSGFKITSAKIKKGLCVTFLGVQIPNSYVTPPQIRIPRDIKTLHDMQQLVGSLQWIPNIILIPPEIMSPLYDLLKGKNPWEQKALTPEASSSLDFIEQQMSTTKLCLAMARPRVAASTTAVMIEEALLSQKGTVSVIHINSHNPIKGLYQTGNDKADAAAKGLWTLRDAQQLHDTLHIRAKAIAKQCGVTISDARHIVATCPHCQKAPLWSSGVNSRGLKASEIWQTDFTLCQLLKPRAWLAVTVDTHSGMIVATQHPKTNSKATIQHWLTAMAWLDVPTQIKTDNGPNFVSKSIQVFASKWNIIVVQGIPYNCTGQAIVEQANQTVKTKLEVLAKVEGFTNALQEIRHSC